MSDLIERLRVGHRPSLVEKAETCASEAELDGFVDGFRITAREPSREVIEAVARRRAQLRKEARG
jgi:hypothetical protein